MTDLMVRVLLDMQEHVQMDEVIEQARAVGFRLADSGRLEALRVLLGSIDANQVERLRGIPGVQSVETQYTVHAAR